MRLHNLIVLSLCLILFSCTKEKSKENAPANKESFQPSTKDSYWYYEDNQRGKFTLTATGRDTVVEGVTLQVFENKSDTSDQITYTLFGQKKNDYYVLGLFELLGDKLLLYLKDNTSPQTKWTQPISINLPALIGKTDAELDFTLVETDMTKEVKGKTYKNVAHVSLKVFASISGLGKIDTSVTGDFYFARGIGLINVVLKTPDSDETEDVSLLNYDIK